MKRGIYCIGMSFISTIINLLRDKVGAFPFHCGLLQLHGIRMAKMFVP
jgi:hypothetical protein